MECEYLARNRLQINERQSEVEFLLVHGYCLSMGRTYDGFIMIKQV